MRPRARATRAWSAAWLCACALAIAAPARAYRFMTTCCGDPARFESDATIKLAPTSFPAGSPQRADFENAARAWSQIQGSWFDWTVISDDDDSVCSECDGSEVGFFDRAGDWGVLGWTTVDADDVFCAWPFCETGIDGADIYFFVHDKDGTPYQWTWGAPPDGAYYQRWQLVDVDRAITGDPRTAEPEPLVFSVVASHELGHAANLGHVSDGAARMEDRQPSGGWFHQALPDHIVTPLADDAAGMRALYGNGAPGVDLYLTSWQDVDVSSDPDDGVDSWPTSAEGTPNGDMLAYPANRVVRGGGRDRLEVWRGDTVDIRVCMGELGPEDVDFGSHDVGGLEFFLSNDRTIGTGDAQSPTTQLFRGVLRAGQVICGVYAFVVPYDVTPGRWYYVGTWLSRGTQTGDVRTNNIAIANRRLFVSR
jgi:hypothetical protein